MLGTHDFLFKELGQGVDQLTRIFATILPPREGFLAAAEKIGELVLRDSETLAKSEDIRTGKQAHVASLGLVDDERYQVDRDLEQAQHTLG